MHCNKHTKRTNNEKRAATITAFHEIGESHHPGIVVTARKVAADGALGVNEVFWGFLPNDLQPAEAGATLLHAAVMRIGTGASKGGVYANSAVSLFAGAGGGGGISSKGGGGGRGSAEAVEDEKERAEAAAREAATYRALFAALLSATRAAKEQDGAGAGEAVSAAGALDSIGRLPALLAIQRGLDFKAYILPLLQGAGSAATAAAAAAADDQDGANDRGETLSSVSSAASNIEAALAACFRALITTQGVPSQSPSSSSSSSSSPSPSSSASSSSMWRYSGEDIAAAAGCCPAAIDSTMIASIIARRQVFTLSDAWVVARLRPAAVDATVLVALLDRFSRDR